jgi:hypothetical protein
MDASENKIILSYILDLILLKNMGIVNNIKAQFFLNRLAN